MISIFNIIKTQYTYLGQSGMSSLFVWCFIVCLYGCRKKNDSLRNMMSYVVGMLICLFCPITAYYIMGVQTGENQYHKMFLLIPVILIILILFVWMYQQIDSLFKKIILMFGLVIVMTLNTTVQINFSLMDKDAVTLCKKLNELGAEKVLAVQSYEETASQCESNTRFLAEPISVIDRNGGATTDEQLAVINMVNLSAQYRDDGDDSTSPAEPYQNTAENNGIEYIVLDDECNDEAFMVGKGYSIVAQSGKYYAYYMEKPRWTITEYASDSGNQAMIYTMEDVDGHFIIIDGGWEADKDQVLRMIQSHDNHVDAWIITHPDTDHVGAFNAIFSDSQISGIVIDTIYFPDVDRATYEATANWWDGLTDYETFLNLTQDWKNIVEVKAGDHFDIYGLNVDFFNSYSNKIDGTDAINDGSLMFKVSGERDSMLFCADVGVGMSEKLIEQWGEQLKADYIQMGHHGNGGLNEDFYRMVHPRIAFSDAPEWLFHPGSGSIFDSEAKTALMESMGATVYYYATAPNSVKLK